MNNPIIREEVIRGSRLIRGECLAVMDKLIEEGIKVDAIITDPPYQTTACAWDTLIPFNKHIMLPISKRSKKLKPIYRDEYILQELKAGREYKEICEYFDINHKEGMWDKLNKLIKPNGAIVLFGSEPFSSALRMSNIKNYKYDWKWNKNRKTGFANAKRMPMRCVEDIIVFYKNPPLYNPQGLVRIDKRVKNGTSVGGDSLRGDIKESANKGSLRTAGKEYVQEFTNYPNQVLSIKSATKTIHPTQKPVALMEYLIKTYTNENELVLDFTSGSGTTAVACENTNRKFIGIELDKTYFEIAKNRIEKAMEGDMN